MRLQVVLPTLGAPGTPPPEPRETEGNRREPRGRPGGPHIPPTPRGRACLLPARGEPRCGDRSAARGRREPPLLLPGAASGVRGKGRRRQKQHRREETPAELPPARGDSAAPQRWSPGRGAAQAAEADGRTRERCSAAARRPPGTVTMVCVTLAAAPPAELLAPRSSSSTRRAGPAPGLSLNPPARGQDRGSQTRRSSPPHWSAWRPAPSRPTGLSRWGDQRPGHHDNRCLGPVLPALPPAHVDGAAAEFCCVHSCFAPLT